MPNNFSPHPSDFSHLKLLSQEEVLTEMKETINKEFGRLLSEVRKTMINECLNYRYNTIKEIIK